MIRTLLWTVTLLIAIVPMAESQPTRALVPVRGDVYRLQAGERATIVLATADAILVADPLDPATARWLRDELARRFPDRPVRYVVPTSFAFARGAGAAVFAPAPIVTHRLYNSERRKAATRLPPALAALDHNHNGRLEPDEWSSAPTDLALASFDADGDGVLTGSNLFDLPANPVTTFRDRQTLDVGGTPVDVVNAGGTYTSFSATLLFRNERLLFSGGSTIAGVFTFRDARPQLVLAWLHALVALPFDDMMDGSGALTSHAELEALVAYLDELFSAASRGYGAGLSVSQAAAVTTLDKYRGNVSDGQRIANVGAIYDALSLSHTDVQGAGVVRWLTRNHDYCESFSGCESGGQVSGGSGAIAFTRSRIGAVVEMSFVEQSFAQRQSQLLDDAFAQRIARGSLLLRFGPRRRTGPAIDFLAGATLLFADTRGVTRVKNALAPTGGRHQFAVQTRATGLTAGVDLSVPVTRAFRLVVPVRVTDVSVPPLTTWPGGLDVQAGIGLSLRVIQRVR